MRENRIKNKLDNGEVLIGMGTFSGSQTLVEMMGIAGFDFVFIDTEHTPMFMNRELQNMIITANSVGMGTIARVKIKDDWMIRTCFEFGADGVVFPHCRCKADVEEAVSYSKFYPMGIRGSATDCRSAGYGVYPDFSFPEYVRRSNKETLVIPLAEDPEFYDNIDEILSVPGIGAVSIGPSDLALSLGILETYNMNIPEVKDRLELLFAKYKEANIPVMSPIAPPTAEKAMELADKGCRLLICRNDVSHFGNILKQYQNTVYKPFKEYWNSKTDK